jgi:hypothetical protein
MKRPVWFALVTWSTTAGSRICDQVALLTLGQAGAITPKHALIARRKDRRRALSLSDPPPGGKELGESDPADSVQMERQTAGAHALPPRHLLQGFVVFA